MRHSFRTAASICLAGFVALSALAHATILYSTDFDTQYEIKKPNGDPYPPFDYTLPLSRQDYWETNDHYSNLKGQTDQLRVDSNVGYSTSSSDYLGILGGLNGLQPGRTDILLGRPVANAVTGGIGATTYHFETTALITSPADTSMRDSFGLVFRHSSTPGYNYHDRSVDDVGPINDGKGSTLFQIALKYDLAQNRLKVSYGIGTGSLVDPPVPYFLPYNSFVTYQVDVSTDSASQDLLNLTITDAQGHSFAVLTNIVLPDGDASLIDETAILWQLGSYAGTNPSSFGSSTFFMRNYLISVIPEPTSFALLAGGAAIFGLRRRR